MCVVELNDGNTIAVNEAWIECPNQEKSKIFYSPNKADQPVFDEPVYYFKGDKINCYMGRVIRSFSKYKNKFGMRKLPKTFRLKYIYKRKQVPPESATEIPMSLIFL